MEVDDLGNEQRPTRGHLFAVGVEQMDFAGCVESERRACSDHYGASYGVGEGEHGQPEDLLSGAHPAAKKTGKNGRETPFAWRTALLSITSGASVESNSKRAGDRPIGRGRRVS